MTDGGDRREYKTVALPKPGSRWGRGAMAERIAQSMSEIINREASAGWRYLGADVIRVDVRVGLTGAKMEKSHTVLVFERPQRAGAAAERSRAFDDHDAYEEERPPVRRGARRAAARDEGVTPAPAAASRSQAGGDRRSRGYGLDDDPGFAADDPYESQERRAPRRRADPGLGGANGSEERPRGLVESMVSSRQRRTD